MRRTRALGALMTVVSLTAAVLPSTAASPPPVVGQFVPGQVLVRFHPGTSQAQRARALEAVRGRVVRSLPAIGYQLVHVAPDTATAIARLRGAPGVAVAEPNYVARIALTPDDRCFVGCVNSARQWNVGAVNAQLGWDVFPGRFYTATEKKTLAPVKVAVLDTKIDVSMTDWANAGSVGLNPHDARNGGQLDVVDARDFVPEALQQGSATYHGTFVAGILGAAANNTADIAGLGYRAEIVPVTVVDGAGFADAARVADGILYASSAGVAARVINLSLGLVGDSSAVEDAVNLATQRGSLVVAAAGNNANNQPFYPAWYGNAMSVTATDEADRPGTCTNHSSQTSVAAPGVGIVSLDPSSPNKISVTPCGTSTAAPHVSALAALLFAQTPTRTPAQVRDIIQTTADDDRFLPGWDEYYGAGRINFERALRAGTKPVVNKVRASFPKATGGMSRVTADALASAPVAVRAAEYFIDAPVQPGAGRAMTAVDGAFDETTEALTADIFVDLNGMTTGVHRLYVRAFDGTTWGPASVGVLIVDRTAPRIAEVSATPTTIPALGKGTEITFRVTDDYATTATFVIKVVRKVGVSETVYESPEETTIVVPSKATTVWMPAATDFGQHEITITVRDPARNPATAMATTLVL